MKKNIQDRWWYEFVQKRPNCLGLDSSVLMNSAGTQHDKPHMHVKSNAVANN